MWFSGKALSWHVLGPGFGGKAIKSQQTGKVFQPWQLRFHQTLTPHASAPSMWQLSVCFLSVNLGIQGSLYKQNYTVFAVL